MYALQGAKELTDLKAWQALGVAQSKSLVKEIPTLKRQGLHLNLLTRSLVLGPKSPNAQKVKNHLSQRNEVPDLSYGKTKTRGC